MCPLSIENDASMRCQSVTFSFILPTLQGLGVGMRRKVEAWLQGEMRYFGRRVRDLRIMRRMTQEQLAAKAELDPKSLGAVERGERNVTLRNILKIAHGLDVEPAMLFLYDRNPSSGSLDDVALSAAIEELDEEGVAALAEIARVLLSYRGKRL